MKTDTTPCPWPFPQWDGTKFVMPVDLMSPEERKAFFKKSKPAPELEDVEEAPF